jgi:hypothetical protein
MDGQTIFAILVGAALACFSLVMVGYAFFRGDSPTPGSSPAGKEAAPPLEPASDDGVGLDAIYDSIDTLELDYQLGNVPEDQYREQLQGYRLQAAVAVKSLLERGEAPPELLLEQEVLAARSSGTHRHAFPQSAVEPVEIPGPVEGWRACPQCDAPIPPDDAPCPHCGAAVGEMSPLPPGEG